MLKTLFIYSTLLLAFLIAIPLNGTVAMGQEHGGEWKTSYSVGKFSNSDPPRPDEIFKIQYRVINGTIDSLNTPPLQVVASVSSSNQGGGLLELQYPRNYPYTNGPESSTAGIDNFIIYELRPGGEEVQIVGNGTTTDCFFVLSVPFTGSVGIGIYSSYIPEPLPFHGDDVPSHCVSETIVDQSSIPPLKQVRAGIASEGVACPEEMELIIHPDDRPFCATPNSVEILRERWNL